MAGDGRGWQGMAEKIAKKKCKKRVLRRNIKLLYKEMVDTFRMALQFLNLVFTQSKRTLKASKKVNHVTEGTSRTNTIHMDVRRMQ